MATEAEIIPELISVVKAEEEITKSSSDLKKSEGGLAMPVGIDECSDKANNIELASNNGVETLDDEKIAEKVTEDDEKMSKIEVIADRESSPEDKNGSMEEEISQNADIESKKQDGNLELKKQDPVADSSNEANEIVAEAGHSDPVQEKQEEKNFEEVIDTEPEKLPALEGKEEGTEATDPIETSKSIGDTLTSKAAETSEIKDNETTSEIREVAEKELQNENPHKEAACIHEPVAEVDVRLEEVSKEPETVSDKTVKESTKEDESIPLELTEKASSSVELEDSKKDTEEKTLVEGSTDTADSESVSVAEKTEEKKQETESVVPTEENGLTTTGHEVVGVDGVDIDVKPVESSVSCEKDKEISKEELSETPLPQAADEILPEKADNPILDVQKLESNETEPECLVEEPNVQTEQAESLQDEQSSDLGLDKEKIEHGKFSDEATADSAEATSTCKDVEKFIQEEEAKQETQVPEGADDQIPEVINVNDNEGQSKETVPELSKSQGDETITVVQNEESDNKINKEPEDKPEDEQNANEVTKAVILSDEVEDNSSVSNECLKEGESKEEVEAKHSEVEEVSTEDRDARVVVESEEKKGDQVSGDPVSVDAEDRESEEKIKDIVDESKQPCQDKSDETVKKVEADTSLDNTEVNEEVVNMNSVEKSLDTSESDANQETKQVENPQHEPEKTALASEPEVNEVKQTKEVPTELVLESKVNEVEQTKAVPETSSECLSQSVQTSTATLPSEDEEIKTAQSTEKIEEEIPKDAEIVKHESTIEEVCLQKEEEREPKPVSVEETILDRSSTLPSKDDLSDAKQTEETCLDKEGFDEVEDGKKDETNAAQGIEEEEPKDQPLASALPEAVVGDETTVSQASITEESMEIETSALPSEKIQEQTTEVKGASNVEVETSERAFDNESIKEGLVKATDEENQCDNKTNEITVNEASKEEVLEVKEVTETSHSILEPKESVKDGSGEDEVKDKLIEDKALETTQSEEDVVGAQKISENEIIDKQIVCEEVPSLESSQADPEGTKGSDNQISKESEPIENTEITSPIVKEHVPIDLQKKIEESSQKAEVEDVKEVYPKEAEVGEKIKDNSVEEITKESTSVEDSTKEFENEKLSVESLKDDANNNVTKEIVAADQTVKDQEQAPVAMKEATIVQGDEAMEKTEARDLQPEIAKEIDNGKEKTDNSGVEIIPEPTSAASGNLSLSDLLQRSEEEKTEVAECVIEESELTVSKEEEAPVEDAQNIQAKEAKIDEVPEGDEQNKTDSGSDAPVMVEAPRDTESKPHKKSQNILSGVGSKVKNSISKVRKAITGKSSSNSKEPKAVSPKGGEK